MDANRAKDIASSPVMSNVTFHRSPVYIENVNEDKGTATIHLLNQPESKQEVPIINLRER